MGHITPAVSNCMALPLVLSMSMDMPCTVNQLLCHLLLPSPCQQLPCCPFCVVAEVATRLCWQLCYPPAPVAAGRADLHLSSLAPSMAALSL